MTIISALLGILLYYFRAKVPHVIILTLLLAGWGFASFVGALIIGALTPRLTSALYKTSALLPLTLGGVLAFLVIWATAWIFLRRGPNPAPSVEAITAAAIAAVGFISDKYKKMDGLRPPRLAARGTYWRYHSRFPQLYGQDSKEYRQAYEAIHNDPISDEQGAIRGWGFDATRRRLKLIGRAL